MSRDVRDKIIDIFIRSGGRINAIEVEEDGTRKPAEALVAIYKWVTLNDRVQQRSGFSP